MRDLVEEYDGWSIVASELRVLSDDIDLSDQIHVAMECLTRIAEALLKEDLPVLKRCVKIFEQVLRHQEDYEGGLC